MRFLTPILFLLIFLNSCTTDCNCTLIGCPCTELSIDIKATSTAKNPNTGFEPSELDSFYAVLTDLNFQALDSVKLNFSASPSGLQDKIYSIQGQSFSNFTGFKNHNIILKNHSTFYTDSISNISYDEKMESRLCNRCDPCDDEYVTCTEYSNKTLSRNGNNQATLEIILINQ